MPEERYLIGPIQSTEKSKYREVKEKGTDHSGRAV